MEETNVKHKGNVGFLMEEKKLMKEPCYQIFFES